MGKKASRKQVDAARMPTTTSIPSKAQVAAEMDSGASNVQPSMSSDLEATPAEKFQAEHEKKRNEAAAAKEQRKAAEFRKQFGAGCRVEKEQKTTATTVNDQLLLKRLTGGFRVSQEGIAARDRADRYQFHEQRLSKYL
mmetsp:Transcript_19632/g.55200  ORF Transcript_19632/g.55200 Transcript_19632/m.55200 type:complete len:139 (-) Transcript_19632:128-544(-)